MCNREDREYMEWLDEEFLKYGEGEESVFHTWYEDDMFLVCDTVDKGGVTYDRATGKTNRTRKGVHRRR